jgi:hypothetical protein
MTGSNSLGFRRKLQILWAESNTIILRIFILNLNWILNVPGGILLIDFRVCEEKNLRVANPKT